MEEHWAAQHLPSVGPTHTVQGSAPGSAPSLCLCHSPEPLVPALIKFQAKGVNQLACSDFSACALNDLEGATETFLEGEEWGSDVTGECLQRTSAGWCRAPMAPCAQLSLVIHPASLVLLSSLAGEHDIEEPLCVSARTEFI